MYNPVQYKVLLYWALLFGVILFGFYVGWDQGVLLEIIQQDQTRVCIFILVLLIGMSCHCAYRSFYLSQQFSMLDHYYIRRQETGLTPEEKAFPDGLSLSQDYLFNVSDEELHDQNADKGLLAELLVEGARGSHQVGWFVVGVMVKLGLLGTVIGFIIMLSSVSGLENLTIDDVKTLMQQMTHGMGIAMSTTLIGLTCSMLLSVQYLLLDRMADRFVALSITLGQQKNGVAESEPAS
ncbi:MotA/TolQ/ExbB proton channel family protein [Neptuniibacter sp. QD72_48]|uniref:MotA/TolQ/ExbB proton channel family protein n=1 Tax=unclassified Neptuniibacter TaxID=2630693 RepID=UPI0039F52222